MIKKTKFRKDVLLIVVGAVLAVASFAINWSISTAIDQRSYEVDEQLRDIDRYLTFAQSSTLEAFELNSSAKSGLAISQLMYFQILQDEPDEAAINAYNGMIANAITNLASAVTAAHAAATGFTIEGEEKDKVLELAQTKDYGQASLGLATLFNDKLKQYQAVSEEKVKSRRKLIVMKSQLAERRNIVGNIAHLVQLLGILIILAKDVVAVKKTDSSGPVESFELRVEQSNERIAA